MKDNTKITKERSIIMETNKKLPLFIITGASCVGKSAMSEILFNRWLKDNSDKTNPNIKLLNNSKLTLEETAQIADAWIRECMANERS